MYKYNWLVNRSDDLKKRWGQAKRAHDKRQYEAAAVLWENYLELDPDQAFARANRVLCLLNTDRPEEALTEARRAYGQQPKSAGIAMALLDGLDGNGLTEELEQKAKKFSRDFPRLDSAWAYLGKAALLRGDYKEAERYLRKAINIRPSFYFALRALGESLMRQRKFDQALVWFGRALKVYMDYPSPKQARFDALIGRGRAFLFVGRPEKGLPLAKEAEAMNMDTAQAQGLRARCEFSLGLTEAISTAENALGLGYEDDFLKLRLAEEYALEGRIEHARKLVDEVSLDSDDYNTRHKKASVFMRLGETERALEELHALEGKLDPHVFFNSLASAHRVAGHLRESVKCLLRALRVKRDEVVLTNAGSMCIELDKYMWAEAFLREALQVKPEFPEASYYLGLCYAYSDRTVLAREQFKKVLDSPTAREVLRVGASDLIGRLHQGQEIEAEYRRLGLVTISYKEKEQERNLLIRYKSSKFEDECCRVATWKKGLLRWSSAEPRKNLRYGGRQKEIDAYGLSHAEGQEIVCLGECKLRLDNSEPVDCTEINELVEKIGLAEAIEAEGRMRNVEGFFFTNADYHDEARELAKEHNIRIFRARLSKSWQKNTEWRVNQLEEFRL